MRGVRVVICALFTLGFGSNVAASAGDAPVVSLPGTEPLTTVGDIASDLVEGIDRFLLGKLAKSVERRARHWNRDFASPEKYDASIELNRKRLAHILGVRDERVPFEGLELCATTSQPALVGRGEGYEAFAVRWPAFGDVHGEGLLLVPEGGESLADVIALPDADQTPEMLAGLCEGIEPQSQFARRLAESGCRVLIPVLIDRNDVVPSQVDAKFDPARGMRLANRELLYRSAFELGRHLIGYELQKVLAGVDFFAREAGDADPRIGAIGWGEGAMLALHAGALDPRIDAVVVSGYFEPREDVWREPIYRNVFGLLEQFGDAELAAMIAPRPLIVEAARGPEVVVVEQETSGGPGRLTTPEIGAVRREVERAGKLIEGFDAAAPITLIESGGGSGPRGSAETLQALLAALSPGATLASPGSPPKHPRRQFDPAARHARQLRELVRHNQWLLGESPYTRRAFFSKLFDAFPPLTEDQAVLDEARLARYRESIDCYREFFHDEVIGRISDERLPPAPRSRKAYDEPTWTGYEVVMDVFPDVIAYGLLLVPKDAESGDKRPVVVCQHGLEGRPQDVVIGGRPAYHEYAARLAERGFVVFAPQNPYLFKDRFRTLQRKANPLKKTLFSVMVPQHQQIVDWLQTLPYVDPERIGFYGLSYGGKSAMRIPALVTDYTLSICSADFNDWVWKNAATNTAGRYSYVWTNEYEIFEFDLGSTFNYAEMAWLIAPRGFMVERGHFDGVAPDERVAYEFAKVRHLYAARLGIADRCRIEWFVGPHAIHGVGTFDFLHDQLDWPKPAGTE